MYSMSVCAYIYMYILYIYLYRYNIYIYNAYISYESNFCIKTKLFRDVCMRECVYIMHMHTHFIYMRERVESLYYSIIIY